MVNLARNFLVNFYTICNRCTQNCSKKSNSKSSRGNWLQMSMTKKYLKKDIYIYIYNFNLNNSPWCHTLLKDIGISKNIALVSTGGLQSNDDWISCIMEKSWDIHESPCMKPDWHVVNKSLSWKCANRALNKSLSKTLAKIGKRLIGHSSDEYILFKGNITMNWAGAHTAARQANERNKGLIFKNWAPFAACICEINNTQIYNAKKKKKWKLWCRCVI